MRRSRSQGINKQKIKPSTGFLINYEEEHLHNLQHILQLAKHALISRAGQWHGHMTSRLNMATGGLSDHKDNELNKINKNASSR